MELRVRGFGRKTLQRLRQYWTFGDIARPDELQQASPGSQRRQNTIQDGHEINKLTGGTKNDTVDIVLTEETAKLNSPRPQVPEQASDIPFEDEEETDDVKGAPPYTDGSSRVTLAHDGTKECLALLLTEDIVSRVNRITTLNRKVEGLQRTYDDAEGDADTAQISLEHLLALLDAAKDLREQNRIHGEISKREEAKKNASKRKEQVEEQLIIYKRNLAYLREAFQELFEGILSPAGLLGPDPEDETAAEASNASETRLSGTSEQRSDRSSNTDDTVISLERLNQLATYEDMLKREQWLQTLQDKFDTRRETYNQEFHDYSHAVENGACSLSKSDFDRIDLSNLQNLTKALVDAEVWHEQVKSQARALGLIGNDWEQESNFVDDPHDCDYLESLEAELCGGVDRDWIEDWSTEVTDSQDQEYPEDQDGDEWDAETVDISDSISLVDRGRNRRRIDRWREICGL